MTAQAKGTRIFCGYTGKVCNGQLLGRNRTFKPHVEIFLPAYQCIICTPKGNKQFSIAKAKGDGRKLRLCLGIHPVHILKYLHILKARAILQSFQQAVILLAQNDGLYIRPSQQRPTGCIHPHRCSALLLHDMFKRQIGKTCQHCPIHLIKRRLRQGQISAPEQIIKDICHYIPSGASKSALLTFFRLLFALFI